MNLADLDTADEPGTWTELDTPAAPPKDPRELQFAYVRTFGRAGGDGQTVLNDLQVRTLGRALPPTASDTERAYLEGQRLIVLHILNQLERGKREE